MCLKREVYMGEGDVPLALNLGGPEEGVERRATA